MQNRALQFASVVMRNDREAVLAAVRQEGGALQFASVVMRNDKEVVLAAVREGSTGRQHFPSEAL